MCQTEKHMKDGSDLNITAPKKQVYKKEEETSVGNVENEKPHEESHMLAPVPFENTGKFQDLQFQPKVKARGCPKHYQRQLCYFNKDAVNQEGAESTRWGRKRKTIANPITTKNRRRLSDKPVGDTYHCPVCGRVIQSDEVGVTSADCCLVLIYSACLSGTTVFTISSINFHVFSFQHELSKYSCFYSILH